MAKPSVYSTVIFIMSKAKFIEGAYAALEEIEDLSRDSLRDELSGWDKIVQNCIVAGGLAPLLPAKNRGTPRVLAASPFLKRALTDLRAVHLMIRIGYTSQAASVAASLWENALTAAVLADSDSLAKEAKSTKYSEIPWSPKQLAKLDAKRALKISYGADNYPQKEYEDNWTISYYNYKWLCQIKHPTWQSVFHDLRSAQVSEGEYAIFPFPCNFSEDTHLKYAVLGNAVSKALEAVKSYFLSLECDEQDEGYSIFEDKINIVHFGVLEQMKEFAGKPSPINVLDRRFIKTDFSTLVEKFEK